MTASHENFTITIEEDIAVPGENDMPSYPYWASHRKKVESMLLGDSFFVPASSSEKLQSFVDYAEEMGYPLIARDTVSDEIYLVPGARVWRVTEELKARLLKQDKLSEVQALHPVTEARTTVHLWWKNGKTGRVVKVQPNVGPPSGEHWFKVPETMYLDQQRKDAEDDEL